MNVGVLGPTCVEGDTSIDLGSRKPRSVLAALALRAGVDVAADTLVELVWGEDAPRGAHGTLHSYVSGLRRALEPGLGPRERPTLLVSTDRGGYRLELARAQVDAHQFAEEVRACHRALAPLATQLDGGPDASWPTRETVTQLVDRLEQALAWWRGDAYADLSDHPDVALERAGLDQLRLTAEEDRALGLLALGDHASVVAATEQAASRDRLRERSWALHALALARSGRQAESLEALREVRSVLLDELGLDPGQELRDLERLVLRQDPALHRWLRPEAADHSPAPPPVRRAAVPTDAPATGRWHTVGRSAERAALLELLDRAESGEPAFGLLVGEPGIGKSRLVDELVEAARGRFAVAVGRCSQDDGAPPLWPWAAVLRALSAETGRSVAGELEQVLTGTLVHEPGSTSPSVTAAFRTWDLIGRELTDAAEDRPVLVVLDDLHWSDAATLRVLSHLVNGLGSGRRIAVVGTRRRWPEPTGPLAEAMEAFARRHVTRLDLAGLDVRDAEHLVEDVTGAAQRPDEVALWHARAGGNPYFLIELARLRDSGAGPDDLPPTVREVILRRLESLPDGTRALLPLAAALGRRFSLDVLAAVAGEDVDEVDDRLQPARQAGLVLDLDPGTASFTHALTRDAVAGSVTPTRLARLHARVAHALESDPRVRALVSADERVPELARHWRAAGPSYAGRAWRAAAAAAVQSRAAFSHGEASELMAAAIESHRRDPAGEAEERYQLLLVRAGDCQRAADWYSVVQCAIEAMALARGLGDPGAVARAAAEITRYCLWTPHDYQVSLEDVIDDLRWALHALPDEDAVGRCQLMLSLAVELYYVHTAGAERRALVDEGLAIARRSSDPPLLWWATRAAWIALWKPSTVRERSELSRESLAVAEQIGDPDLVALSEAVCACDALELGRLTGYDEHSARAARIAKRRRLAFVSYVLGFVDLTLAGMRGEIEAAHERAAELRELRFQTNLPAQEYHEDGLALASAVWLPAQLGHFVDAMLPPLDGPGDDFMVSVGYACLARVGRTEELRERMARFPPPRHPEDWGSSMDWSLLAEVAAAVGDRPLAAYVQERLLPLVGQMAVSGFSVALGPVDGFLALAEVTLGNREAAGRYADRAVSLAQDWDLPFYVTWLEGHREALGF